MSALELTLVAVVALSSTLAQPSNDDLTSVVVLFRHGDRAPVAAYKNDPYDESYWPLGFGQLTNIGKNQHYALGEWFRERYGDFLSSQYNKSDIKVYSSNVDRCLMSAAANLAGLYPPDGDQVWNPRLSWQPIPIHTVPEQDDALLAQDKPCPKYWQLLEELLTSEPFASMLAEHQELFEYISEQSGEAVTDLIGACDLYDILFIENLYDLTLPEWTDNVTAQLAGLCNVMWSSFAFNPDLARLRTGPLLDLITGHFENVTSSVAGTSRFLMLSAHDSTVAPLLTALQVFDMNWPQYASTVIFELRSNVLSIFYKNSTDVTALTLPDCATDCSLDSFKKIVAPIRIKMEDWDAQCNDI